MEIGIVLVGDELLSGKRQDKHLAFVIHALASRGMELSWARMVRDDMTQLTQCFTETFATKALVFSFGGIGGTPDDITRQCAAQALNIPIVAHPEFMDILQEKFGQAMYPNRVRMAELPQGADLIPNPVNQIPGFSLQTHYFVPGFPNMAQPMVEWVLDTHYSAHFNADPDIEIRLDIPNTPESQLVTLQEIIVKEYPEIRLSSLPNTQNRRQVEIGLRGQRERVVQAKTRLIELLSEAEIPFVEI